jgi:orotate phosphoribosyltransferase
MRESIEKEEAGKRIINLLYESGMIKTWFKEKNEGWTLFSGLWSPFYLNLRSIGSKPNSDIILKEVGLALGNIIKNDTNANKIVGVSLAGIPLAVATTMCSGIPSCFTRKVNKDGKVENYGEKELIEGELCDGDELVILDDLVTDCSSKFQALKQINQVAESNKLNVKCSDVVVLFDRGQGANEIAKENNMNLFSLINFKENGIEWLKPKLSDIEYTVIKDYLENDEKYQDKEYQKDIIELSQSN